MVTRGTLQMLPSFEASANLVENNELGYINKFLNIP